MHLWLIFQLLVIKGPIIMTASSVLWWWVAIFPLITPSQSLIYCQPSPLCHAAISCLRGRARIDNRKKSTGEIREGTAEERGEDFYLAKLLSVSGCFSSYNVVRRRKKNNIWWFRKKTILNNRFACSNSSNLISLIIQPQVSSTNCH